MGVFLLLSVLANRNPTSDPRKVLAETPFKEIHIVKFCAWLNDDFLISNRFLEIWNHLYKSFSSGTHSPSICSESVQQLHGETKF